MHCRIPPSVVAAAALFTGCSAGELHPYSETVMSPGMQITATNPNGTVRITARNGTRRTYVGSGWEKSAALIARSERWDGSLGLYDPADSSTPYGRLLVQEGRIHCASVSEAMRWLDVASDSNRPVYTNNGLAFFYSINAAPNAPRDSTGEPERDVEIWQIYIKGRRPERLPGANDRAIHVEGGSIPESSTPYPAPVGYEMVLSPKEYAPAPRH